MERASRAAVRRDRAADQDPPHEPLRPDRDDAAGDPAEPEAERLQGLPPLLRHGGGEDPRCPTVGLFSSPPFPRPFREMRGRIELSLSSNTGGKQTIRKMSITITLPDDVQAQLQRAAESQRRSVEEVALDILADAAGAGPAGSTPEEVVARIRATSPNPQSILAATASLAAALRNAPHVPDFNLGVWEHEWAVVVSQIRATTRANDIAEGRA